jgi:phosphoglycerol geranylgeranyltransferase
MSPIDLVAFFRSSRFRRRIHLTSLDPARHDLTTLPRLVRGALASGTDGFLLGGSTDVDGPLVEHHAAVIRQTIADIAPPAPVPLVLFPSSAPTGIAGAADGVLFLSLLNSNDVRFLIREQAKAAPFLPAFGLQPVGCGMIMIEPGGTAGRVGHADLIRRDDWLTAVGYAAAAASFGFPLVYLNAGSGSPTPVPPEMIRAVAQVVRVPLVVGGGLTDAAKVRAAVEAGADVIITGTAVEQGADVTSVLPPIVAAVHQAPPKEPAADSPRPRGDAR